MSNKDWFQLDTAAKIYPSISQTHNNAVFRLEAVLTVEVDKNVLQEALVRIMPRFPSFAVTLKKGLYWYYYEKNPAIPVVAEESGSPCKRLKDLINNGFLFSVTYYKKNITLEIFHGLADGRGAVEFFKTLLYEYLLLCGYPVEHEDMVLDPEDQATTAEVENSFKVYYDSRGKYTKLRTPRAYHIMGTPTHDNAIFLIDGLIHLPDFLAYVRKREVTVSAYIASLMILCIAKEQGLEYKKEKHPVIISVPMDLRGMFPSATLRNFISFANVSYLVKGKIDFDDILKDISHQLKEGLSKESISANINKNVRYERNLFVRMTPLFVKNIAVSQSYKNYGEGSYTMVLSNLGITTFPHTMSKYIEQVYYSLGVSEMNPMNCVMVSYKDKMAFSFARGIRETGIIRRFFEHFSKDLKMKVEIRGNEWSKG